MYSTTRLLIVLTILTSVTGILFVSMMISKSVFGFIPGIAVVLAIIYTILSFAIFISLFEKMRRNERLEVLRKLNIFGLREKNTEKDLPGEEDSLTVILAT